MQVSRDHGWRGETATVAAAASAQGMDSLGARHWLARLGNHRARRQCHVEEVLGHILQAALAFVMVAGKFGRRCGEPDLAFLVASRLRSC
jgi:hypothetical protein